MTKVVEEVRVQMWLAKDEQEELVRQAILAGFTREHPKRAWTPAEKRQAIGFAVRSIMDAKLNLTKVGTDEKQTT